MKTPETNLVPILKFTELPADLQPPVREWLERSMSYKGCNWRMTHYLTGEENVFKTIGDLDIMLALLTKARKELTAAHGLEDFPPPNIEL